MTGREQCELLLSVVQELYPGLGLTFGYIGNCGPGFGDTKYDDRSWYFFSSAQIPGDYLIDAREKFGGVSTANLDDLARRAMRQLGDWCECLAVSVCMRKHGCTECDFRGEDDGGPSCHTLS